MGVCNHSLRWLRCLRCVHIATYTSVTLCCMRCVRCVGIVTYRAQRTERLRCVGCVWLVTFVALRCMRCVGCIRIVTYRADPFRCVRLRLSTTPARSVKDCQKKLNSLTLGVKVFKVASPPHPPTLRHPPPQGHGSERGCHVWR